MNRTSVAAGSKSKHGWSRGIAAALCAAMLGLGLSFPHAFADDSYPSQPIRLVVGFPPGGPTDVIGRVIGRNLSAQIGQPVIIENHGGVGGVIGANDVVKAKPDGYTLLVSVQSSQTRALALNGTIPYDQEKSFTFIRKVAKQHSLVVVNPKFPVNSIAELIAYLKAHPGEVNTGGTFATSSHIGGTLFDMANDTKMAFINYPGGAQPIIDTISGLLQVGFFTEPTVGGHVKAGKLRALAIAAPERSATFPDLPTVEEAGGKPMLDPSPWFGVVGPANMPPEIVKKIGDALDLMTESKEFLDELQVLGAVPIRGTTAQSFAHDVAEEIVFWNKWAKDVKVENAR